MPAAPGHVENPSREYHPLQFVNLVAPFVNREAPFVNKALPLGAAACTTVTRQLHDYRPFIQ